MRIVLISDSHTKHNIELILEYLKKKSSSWKIDLILINGDILGENEAREGYGFRSNKKIFDAPVNKEEILKTIAPNAENLIKISKVYERGIKDDSVDLEMSGYVKEYVEHRYNYLFDILLKFSKVCKTFFNIGTYESPLHYKVVKELSFLINVPETYLRSIAMLSPYRETFKEFLKKINDKHLKNLEYLGGNTIIVKDVMFAAIPGLNHSSGAADSVSEFQEKITTDLINTTTRQLSYATKLVLLNPVQGKLRKDPFTFRPSSLKTRKFIEDLKGKLRHKIFIQSYHHFMTTHFYEAGEFNYILNNSAVNNGLFNMIEISNKVSCFDIDPIKDKVRKLKSYNYNLAEFDSPSARLNLNYEDSKELIKERELDGCYYI
jgi:hypothetical protein